MPIKKNWNALICPVAGLFLVVGFAYPSLVSLKHLQSDRGRIEAGFLNIAMEDWRIVQPCAPIGYLNDVKDSRPSCSEGEDEKVVQSACWFGVPGPRVRLCYKDANSSELGTGRPVILP
jgi:hypothetical protein